jgi:uncharacterized protein
VCRHWGHAEMDENTLSVSSSLDAQSALIDAVVASLREEGHAVEQFETHLSRVVVAGGLAYKFKKALRYDFVDFSTLAARRYFCREEVRLNKRLAPRLYIDVVHVGDEQGRPILGGLGDVLEYAVRMRAFGQHELWSMRITDPGIADDEIDRLAAVLGSFHMSAEPAADASDWGGPAILVETADATLASLALIVDGPAALRFLPTQSRVQAAQILGGLQKWETEQRVLLKLTWSERKSAGMVRECHGDLHCANILTTRHGVEVFDCIEFAPELRWIDVMNDLAFAVMDLAFRGAPEKANRLLNVYLEQTGFYEGLAVLRYYLVQRALVRAKVSGLRAAQEAKGSEDDICQTFAYLAFAAKLSQPERPVLMITHGYSGSGKTTFARRAAKAVCAVQLRSDVERKRMQGMKPNDRESRTTLYQAATTERTYARLLELARDIIKADFSVLVDAAFLLQEQRAVFRELAASLGVPFLVFDVQAAPDTMRSRVATREATGDDASDAGLAVLEAQFDSGEALTPEELETCIGIDMEKGVTPYLIEKACLAVRSAIQADFDLVQARSRALDEAGGYVPEGVSSTKGLP